MIVARVLPMARICCKWSGNERYDCVTSNHNGHDHREFKWVPPGLHSTAQLEGEEGGRERKKQKDPVV